MGRQQNKKPKKKDKEDKKKQTPLIKNKKDREQPKELNPEELNPEELSPVIPDPRLSSLPSQVPEPKEKKDTPTKTETETETKKTSTLTRIMENSIKSLYILVMIILLIFLVGITPKDVQTSHTQETSPPSTLGFLSLSTNLFGSQLVIAEPLFKVDTIELVKRHIIPAMSRTPDNKLPTLMRIKTSFIVSVTPSSDQSFLNFIKAAQSLQSDLDRGCVSLDLGSSETIRFSSSSPLISITENQGLKCETQFSFFTEEAVSQNPRIIDFVLKDADTDTNRERKRKFVFFFITKTLDTGLDSFKKVWNDNWFEINNANPETFPKRFHDRIIEKFLL